MFYQTCQNFIEYLGTKESAKSTITNYTHYLKRFQQFVGDFELKDFNIFLVDKFVAVLTTLNLDVTTRNQHLAALKSFCKYCKHRGLMNFEADAIEYAKEPEKPIVYITKEEFEVLVNCKPLNSTIDLRDRTIIETLFATGLRVQELTNLNKQDLDFETKQFPIVGKGKRCRLIFLSDRAIYWLKRYLEFRNDGEQSLFINYRNNMGSSKRLTPVSIESMVKAWVLKSGLQKIVTPHTLRHSFASALLASGVDIRQIQLLLGHKNIMTTMKYLHCADSQLKNSHQLCFS